MMPPAAPTPWTGPAAAARQPTPRRRPAAPGRAKRERPGTRAWCGRRRRSRRAAPSASRRPRGSAPAPAADRWRPGSETSLRSTATASIVLGLCSSSGWSMAAGIWNQPAQHRPTQHVTGCAGLSVMPHSPVIPGAALCIKFSAHCSPLTSSLPAIHARVTGAQTCLKFSTSLWTPGAFPEMHTKKRRAPAAATLTH